MITTAFRFDDLPRERNNDRIAAAVGEIVGELHRSGCTYEDIARRAGRYSHVAVSATSVRLFLTRGSVIRRKNGNTTLAALYDFLMAEKEQLPESVRERISGRYEALFGGVSLSAASCLLASALAAQYQNWLEVPPNDLDELSRKLCRNAEREYVDEIEYGLLRRSLHEGWFVKSHLKLRKHKEHRNVVSAEHYQRDRADYQKISRGVLIPVKCHIFGVMKVERGEAMEFLAIDNPLQEFFERMTGMLTGIATDRQVFSTGFVMKREDDELWKQLPGRFRFEGLSLDDKSKRKLWREIQLLPGVVKAKQAFLEPEIYSTLEPPASDVPVAA